MPALVAVSGTDTTAALGSGAPTAAPTTTGTASGVRRAPTITVPTSDATATVRSTVSWPARFALGP